MLKVLKKDNSKKTAEKRGQQDTPTEDNEPEKFKGTQRAKQCVISNFLGNEIGEIEKYCENYFSHTDFLFKNC